MKVAAETQRLALCVFSDNDVEAVQEFWGNAEVMAQAGGAASSEVLPKVIKEYQQCHSIYNLSVYAVVEKETNCVIGAAGFNVTDSIERVELNFKNTEILNSIFQDLFIWRSYKIFLI